MTSAGRSNRRNRASSTEQTKTDASYGMLRERIANGTYGSGYRLVIDELARESGMSAIPWREAIRRLEAEGWLEIVPHVGARVVMFDADSYENAMQLLARLEGFATAKAMGGLTATDLAAARTFNEKMVQALADFDPVRFNDLNREFHSLLCSRSGDEHLNKVIAGERNRLELMRSAVFSFVPGRARASVQEHDALLELLADGVATFDEVESAARQHNLNTLDALHQHLDKPGPRPA